RTFPAETPLGALDVGVLARLDVAGGNIRNIGINAAFLAADSGARVEMDHVLAAARSEYAKLERPLSQLELEGRPCICAVPRSRSGALGSRVSGRPMRV